VRGIHFFDRSWEPILSCGVPKLGREIWLIFYLPSNIEKEERFLRRDITVVFSQDRQFAFALARVKSDTFLRNSFYASVLHLCKQWHIFDQVLLLGGGF
jgi:hypothetical protein